MTIFSTFQCKTEQQLQRIWDQVKQEEEDIDKYIDDNAQQKINAYYENFKMDLENVENKFFDEYTKQQLIPKLCQWLNDHSPPAPATTLVATPAQAHCHEKEQKVQAALNQQQLSSAINQAVATITDTGNCIKTELETLCADIKSFLDLSAINTHITYSITAINSTVNTALQKIHEATNPKRITDECENAISKLLAKSITIQDALDSTAIKLKADLKAETTKLKNDTEHFLKTQQKAHVQLTSHFQFNTLPTKIKDAIKPICEWVTKVETLATAQKYLVECLNDKMDKLQHTIPEHISVQDAYPEIPDFDPSSLDLPPTDATICSAPNQKKS